MIWPESDANHLIVTSSQMEEVEKELFLNGMPVESLMEKVGLAISRWLLENTELLKDGVVVLVGPGHNGGDGLVIARELFLSDVRVSIWCPLPIKQQLTSKHFYYCKWLGIDVISHEPDCARKELWIDALFGLKQCRPLPESIGSSRRNETYEEHL